MEEHNSISTIMNSALKVNEEKRKFTRITVSAKAVMIIDGQTIDGELVNISLIGAFVATDQPIELGTPVTITIFDTPTSRMISDVRAKVVRVMDNGVALQFE